MKELSLNILDITENSVKAGATLTEILLTETDSTLIITIRDNGCGMDEATVKAVTDPFYTTRTTRSVGLGIPLLLLAAEQTGGTLKITSVTESENPKQHGTEVTAHFHKDHIDYTPLGDIISTIVTLIQGHPETDFFFRHTVDGKEITLDTREIKAVLDGVPITTFEVLEWIKSALEEQYK